MLNRSNPPAFRAIEHIDFLQPELQYLRNEIPFYKINAPDQDLIKLEFIFYNALWDVNKPLQAISSNALMTSGTPKYTAQMIAEQVDYYGAFLQPDYTADYSSIVLYTLNKHLEAVLPLVKDIIKDCVFPQEEVQIYAQNQKQRYKVNLQKNDMLARRKFSAALFGASPYGFDVLEHHYDEIQQQDLQDFKAQIYQSNNCMILASGHVDEQVFHRIDRLFGDQDWMAEKLSQASLQIPHHSAQKIYEHKEDALQSSIRIGKRMVQRSHADFAGLQVLNTVLGGYFGSRLMNNIREDKGFTYGIGSGIVSLKHDAYFFISTDVGADVCAQALTEIYKEINTLKDTEIPESELALVQSYMLGSILGSLENVFSHADRFKSIYFSGLGYSYYDNYIKTVKNITGSELRLLAQRYFDPMSMTEVVVGKK